MIIDFFCAILLYSNFIITGLFVFMINRLIKSSELLGHKHSKIKTRPTSNFDQKISINTLILSLLAVGFLFKLIQNILLIIIPLPGCPFLDFMNALSSLVGSRRRYNYTDIKNLNDLKSLNEESQLIILGIVMISFFSFFVLILSIYFTIYRKMIIEGDLKGLKYIIFSLTICIIFGMPFMLRLIVYNSTLGLSI